MRTKPNNSNFTWKVGSAIPANSNALDQALSQDLSGLSFRQAVSWKPPFQKGKTFYEELWLFRSDNQIFS